MRTATLAFAGAIETRSGQDAGVKPRMAPERTEQPLTKLIPSAPAKYRAKPWPGKLMAVGMTITIHALLTAIVIYDWNRPKSVTAPDDTIIVTLLPLAPDEPAKRENRGVVAAEVPTKPALAELPPPVTELPRPPAVVVAEPAIEPPPIPADGGKDNQLAQTMQAYRQAIMAELAAERSYPRGPLLAGYEGAGTILFHIDRDGRLLDVAIETSTGRKALDRAALALVRSAAPFPAVPPEMPDRLEVSLPIRFLIITANTAVAAR
jgi:protein TonB